MRGLIRLQTRRGAVEIKVRSDRDVPENMVLMPFCYAEAAANLLTNPALDPFGKIPEFKFCAVRAEMRRDAQRGGVNGYRPCSRGDHASSKMVLD
nr:molybdopterin dinucleotide binding domain-containing protein [Bradyrhizobium erythrophlei]